MSNEANAPQALLYIDPSSARQRFQQHTGRTELLPRQHLISFLFVLLEEPQRSPVWITTDLGAFVATISIMHSGHQ